MHHLVHVANRPREKATQHKSNQTAGNGSIQVAMTARPSTENAESFEKRKIVYSRVENGGMRHSNNEGMESCSVQ